MNNYETNKNENPQQQTYVTYIPYGLTAETFEERKKIRKTANTIGISLLIVLAVSETAVYILRFILSLFGLWNSKTIAFIADPAFNQIFNAVFSVLMFTLPFIAVYKASNERISSLIKFKKPKLQDILPYGLLGISFCSIANILVAYLGNFFSIFGIEYNVDYGEKPQGIFGFMLTFIAVAVIPPLVEEFAFRGIVLGSLRKISNTFAVITSAALFGFLHGNFQQMPFAFLVGLVLGFVTVKTNSIWLAVGIHAINNAVSVFFDYAFMGQTQALKGIWYMIYLIFSLMLGIFAIYLLEKRKNAYKLKSKKTAASTGKIFNWFFTTPTIIIFIIFSVIKSMRFFV